MSFISWFKEKSISMSRENIQELLEQLVPVCNKADEDIKVRHATDQRTHKEINRLKDKLIIQLCGPIPLDEVQTTLIDPVLARPNTSVGAYMAIMHCLELVQSSGKDK
jgi:hypothetical protein